MKINIVIQTDTPDAGDTLIEKLRDIGFTDGDDGASLVYDGDITANDLHYGAAMAKNLINQNR